ncbi:MAG TPA: Bax inhibitor-1/YccA family protein [Caulobacteraceae bacterium]|jgi:hypothetical protein|nr:Bax inhibitor-1/YccA family protein [Caulobacteraceae bacterium]
MSDFDRGLTRPAGVATPDMAVDAGLRAFMLGVYNKLALGLVVSAILASLTGLYPPARALMFHVGANGQASYTLLGAVVAFGPIAILLFQAFARRQSPQSAGLMYWIIVSMIGASLGLWFLRFTPIAIVQTFLVTATAFGGLSLVGYTTKRDLQPMGSFLIMGVWGLVIAMLASYFFHSGLMVFLINVVGLLIFAGLTAYDTQRLKLTYYHLGGDTAAMSAATSWGALSLYLDFINMFQFLLYLMGGSRR